jgi:hypothetical protein
VVRGMSCRRRRLNESAVCQSRSLGFMPCGRFNWTAIGQNVACTCHIICAISSLIGLAKNVGHIHLRY